MANVMPEFVMAKRGSTISSDVMTSAAISNDTEMTSAEVARLTGLDAPRISRGELARYGLTPLRVHTGPHGYRRRLWPRAAVECLARDLARLRAERDALCPRSQ
jgi:hypothetical protein